MEMMAVTGGAGFIGSNLSEFLLSQGHSVVLIDNFSTGRDHNISAWAPAAGARLRVLLADINETDKLREAFQGVRYVFHQAAIPSVPRSVANPQATNMANVDGTLSVLVAARDAGVRRVVVASSSSVYGDDPGLPKVESRLGRPLSPYALSKTVCEEYCWVFHRLYGLETVCLRYFNVFGPRQDPKSDYAAVIPRFSTRMLAGQPPTIYGDGEQSRDFTYVADVLNANWKAAVQPLSAGEVFNVGCGVRTTLNQVVSTMNQILGTQLQPIYEPARIGDVRHSLADISKARKLLEFSPSISLEEGLRRVLNWYREQSEPANVTS
jgi:UDP-glucose 4-epimerase